MSVEKAVHRRWSEKCNTITQESYYVMNVVGQVNLLGSQLPLESVDKPLKHGRDLKEGEKAEFAGTNVHLKATGKTHKLRLQLSNHSGVHRRWK